MIYCLLRVVLSKIFQNKTRSKDTSDPNKAAQEMVDVAFNYNDQEDYFNDESEEFDSDDLIQPIHSSKKMARLR